MATPVLGITLLQESQNSKYVTVNNALYALAGVGVQAMADADQTPTGGVAGNAVIQCTGALSADRHLILPNAMRIYAIDNQTTGSHNIVVKTAGSGSTVSIAAGCKSVYCDGANNFKQIGS